MSKSPARACRIEGKLISKSRSYSTEWSFPDGTTIEIDLPSVLEDAEELNIHRTKEGYVVSGLVHDADVDDPILDEEWWILLSLRRGSPGQEEAIERWEKYTARSRSLDDTEDIAEVWLDVYSHGGECWAIMGSLEAARFPDRRWDVGSPGGVLVATEAHLKELREYAPHRIPFIPDEVECKTQLRAFMRAELLKQAEISLKEYNAWLRGDCWGACVYRYDLEGNEVDDDCCWGYIGREYAEEELKNATDDMCQVFV